MAGIALASGTVVAARYRLERLLGEGGMGVVWAAAELGGDRSVALKFVKEAAADPALFKRLLQEARAACAIHHPNVVQVHEVLELESGAPALVMEVLEGESLAARLDRERELSLDETARLLVPVLSAVGTAHSLGIVHRDLKPENIFITRDANGAEDVKVLDFGIAKITALDDSSLASAGLTRTGALLGTPYYMAPEQVFGEKLDHRVDVWALGLILYRCLSGLLPTERDNVGQVLKAILTRSIWPLADAVPDLPRDVTSLVDSMLAKNRAERLADLRPALDVLARHARDIEAIEFGRPTQPVAEIESEATRSVATAAAAAPRFRVSAALVTVGAVAAVAGLVWASSRANPETQKPTSEPAPAASSSPAPAAAPANATPPQAAATAVAESRPASDPPPRPPVPAEARSVRPRAALAKPPSPPARDASSREPLSAPPATRTAPANPGSSFDELLERRN